MENKKNANSRGEADVLRLFIKDFCLFVAFSRKRRHANRGKRGEATRRDVAKNVIGFVKRRRANERKNL